MNHVINFETTVDLPKVTNVYNLNYRIDDYKLGSVLEGKIVLYGKYVKDNLEDILDYEEVVDFTVDFDEERYQVTKLDCENLNYEVIFGRGINVTLDLRIDYEEPNMETELLKDKVNEETDEILEEVLKNRDDSFLDDEIAEFDEIEVERIEEEETIEELDEKIEEIEKEIEEIEETVEVVTNEVEENKEEIVERKVREIEFDRDVEKEERKIEINEITTRDNNESILGNLQETYSTYKVVFNVNEQNVEELARKYNKSVEDIYKDNNYSIKKNLLIKDDSKE